MNDHVFNSDNYQDFERDNPNICLTVFDENENVIYNSNNKSLITANILKTNFNRYKALQPNKYKNTLFRVLIKQVNQKDIYDFIMNKILS